MPDTSNFLTVNEVAEISPCSKGHVVNLLTVKAPGLSRLTDPNVGTPQGWEVHRDCDDHFGFNF